MTGAFFLLGMGIVVGLRALGYDPPLDWEPVIVVSALTMAPLGFLAGLGGFDYWVAYALGQPAAGGLLSGHGAYSWRDYFRVNTDHKVIGIQYVATTIFFFLAGGLLAMLVRAELAQPATSFFDTQTYNELFTVNASLMIFLFIIPAFAGLANYVLPLMIGAPDMAFPRLNALSYWLLPIAGIMLLCSFFFPGVGAGWTNYATLSTTQPFGNAFFSMAVQWAGASSIMTALNFLVTIITMRAPGMTFWRMPLLVWANFDVTARRDRDAVHRRVAVLRHVRQGDAHELLQPRRGRLRAGLPAHLLVLLAPGRLHHDAARLRDRLGGDLDVLAQADLRLPPDGALADGDPRARLLGLGAPHVRVRDGDLPARADDGDDPADRDPDRDQGLLLAGDAVGGRLHRRADAVGARLRLDVRDRRALRDHARRGPDRHLHERHVLHRRPHPLRAARRLAVHDLRRDLLLVPEDDGPDVQRDGSPRSTSG